MTYRNAERPFPEFPLLKSERSPSLMTRHGEIQKQRLASGRIGACVTGHIRRVRRTSGGHAQRVLVHSLVVSRGPFEGGGTGHHATSRHRLSRRREGRGRGADGLYGLMACAERSLGEARPA